MSKMDQGNLLKESSELVEMLIQLSIGLSKSDIKSAEIPWSGYIQNLELIKSKIAKVAHNSSELEANFASSPKASARLNREGELSPAIARRIKRAPEGKFREVPLNYAEETEDFDEDRMVR